MLLLDAPSKSGFTLTEVMITLVIVGVLSAIITPSFSAWVDRYKLDNALMQLQGSLKEVQKQSIRKSQLCSVTINTTDVSIAMTSGYSNCLPTGSKNLNNVGLSSSSSLGSGLAIATDAASTTPTVAFTFRGTTSDADVFVLYKPNSSIPMKCLVISQGLGIMRIGRYSSASSPPTSISASNCITTAQ